MKKKIRRKRHVVSLERAGDNIFIESGLGRSTLQVLDGAEPERDYVFGSEK